MSIACIELNFKITEEHIQQALDKKDFETLQTKLNHAYHAIEQQKEKNEAEKTVKLILTHCLQSAQKLQDAPMGKFLAWLLRKASAAGDVETVKMLLEAYQKKQISIVIDAPGIPKLDSPMPQLRKTALYWAVEKGHIKIVKILLDNGANPAADTFHPDKSINTPAKLAFKNDELNTENAHEIYLLIVQYASRNGEIAEEVLCRSVKGVTLPEFDEEKFNKYITNLARYLRRVFEENTTIQKLSEFIGKFYLEKQSILREFPRLNKIHKQEVNSFELYLKFWNNFFNAAMFLEKCSDMKIFKSNPLLHVIAEVLKFERKFPVAIAQSKENVLNFLNKNFTTEEAKEKNEAYLILINRFELQCRETMQEILGILKRSIGHLTRHPDNLVNYMSEYFPGDKLDQLCIYSKLQELQGLAKNPVELKNLGKRIFIEGMDIRPICGDILSRYRETIKKRIESIFSQQKSNLKMAAAFSGLPTSTQMIELFYTEFFKRAIQNWENQCQVFQTAVQGRSECLTLSFLADLFSTGDMHCETYETNLPQLFDAVNDNFHAITKNIQHTMSTDQQNHDSQELPDFEEVLKAQKAFQKAQESKRRQEAKLSAEREAKLKQEALAAEEKAKTEVKVAKETVENLLKKLLNPTKDEKALEKMLAILSGNTDMPRQEFFALVTKLQLKGFESIPSNTDTLPDNKGKFTIGEEPVGFHTRHGRADAKMIEPAVLSRFRKILEELGLNKDNFEARVKECAEPTAQPSPIPVVFSGSAQALAQPSQMTGNSKKKKKNKKHRAKAKQKS